MTSQVCACWEFKPLVPSGGKVARRCYAVRAPAARGRQTTHRALRAAEAPEASGKHRTFSGEASLGDDTFAKHQQHVFILITPHSSHPTPERARVHTPFSLLSLITAFHLQSYPTAQSHLRLSFCPWTFHILSSHFPMRISFSV